MLRRLPAALAVLLMMAAFYLFAVMQENEETRRSDAFVVREPEVPVTRAAPFQSQDAPALARAFGVPLPLPEGPVQGGGHQRKLPRLPGDAHQGARPGTQVDGIRPLSAAGSILPSGLRFTASDRALFGYAIMAASDGQTQYYALQTDKAAFLIRVPEAAAPAGGFALQEP